MKFETKSQLANAIREDIRGELEAVIQYDNHLNATDDPAAKAVWTEIRNEERAHVGELLMLLSYIDPNESKHLAEGEEEVKKILEEILKN